MAETLLYILIYLSAIGLVAFIVVYVLVRPWHDPMGRNILAFMSSLGLAFLYQVLIVPLLSNEAKIIGWCLIIGLITVVIWWRLWIIVKLQIRDEIGIYHLIEKLKRK